MAKGNNGLLIGILIVGLIFVFTQSSKIGLQATLGPEDYQTFACADVTAAIADGYTLESTDSHGCQIYSKMLPGIPQEGWCAVACNPGGCSNNPGSCLCGCGPSYYDWHSGSPSAYGYSYGGCVGHCDTPTYVKDLVGGWTAIVGTCQYDAGDLLAAQTFPGNTTVYRNSTRYPIKNFCNAHPAIITDSSTVPATSQTSTTVYDKIWNYSSVTTTSYQTLTLFYTIQNNYQLPTYCGEGNALSVNTCIQGADGTYTCSCVPSLGFVYVCSAGIFDPALGLCVVQPSTACPTWNGIASGKLVKYTNNGTYYCLYDIPSQADCSPYGLSAYYDVNQNKCIFTPSLVYSPCTLGQFNNVTKLCVYTPLNSTTPCPAGYNTTITGGITTCILTPPSQKVCPSGTNYSIATDTCKVPVTKISYSCDGGTLSSDNLTCVRTPNTILNGTTSTVYGQCPAGTNQTITPGICTLPPLIVQQNSSVNSSSIPPVVKPFDFAPYLPWIVAAGMAIGIGYLLMRRK